MIPHQVFALRGFLGVLRSDHKDGVHVCPDISANTCRPVYTSLDCNSQGLLFMQESHGVLRRTLQTRIHRCAAACFALNAVIAAQLLKNRGTDIARGMKCSMLFGVLQRMPEGFASTVLRLQEQKAYSPIWQSSKPLQCKAAFVLVAFL